MYDQFAYLALGMVAVMAVLFLAWFGNHTAGMYARLFGHIPNPPQIPKEPVERIVYRDREREYSGDCTVMTSCYSVCSSSVGAVLRNDWR